MSIASLQVTNAVNDIVGNRMKSGFIPTVDYIISQLSDFYKQVTPGYPSFQMRQQLYRKLWNVDTYNSNLNQIYNDINNFYETIVTQFTVELSDFNYAETERRKLLNKIAVLSGEVQNLMLLATDTSGAMYAVSDNFQDNSKINLSYTTCAINNTAGMVTIGESQSGIVAIDLSYYYNTINFPIVATSSYASNILSNSLMLGTAFGNAFQNNQTSWTQEIITSKPGDLQVYFTINISPNNTLGVQFTRIEISGQSPNPFTVTPTYSSDNINFSPLPVGFSTSTNQSASGTTTIWNFNQVTATYIKFLIDKPEDDNTTTYNGNLAYQYIIGFTNISIYQMGYSNSSVIYSDPFTITDKSGDALTIDKATLVVNETIPTGASIDYYLSLGTTPTPLLIDGEFNNWNGSANLNSWTKYGTTSLFRVTSPEYGPSTYAAEVSSPNSGYGAITQTYSNYAAIAGNQVTLGAWVWADVANVGNVAANDGINTYYSPSHPGDSNWHYLTTTFTVSSSATQLEFYMQVIPVSSTAYFDTASAYEGTSTPNPTTFNWVPISPINDPSPSQQQLVDFMHVSTLTDIPYEQWNSSAYGTPLLVYQGIHFYEVFQFPYTPVKNSVTVHRGVNDWQVIQNYTVNDVSIYNEEHSFGTAQAVQLLYPNFTPVAGKGLLRGTITVQNMPGNTPTYTYSTPGDFTVDYSNNLIIRTPTGTISGDPNSPNNTIYVNYQYDNEIALPAQYVTNVYVLSADGLDLNITPWSSQQITDGEFTHITIGSTVNDVSTLSSYHLPNGWSMITTTGKPYTINDVFFGANGNVPLSKIVSTQYAFVQPLTEVSWFTLQYNTLKTDHTKYAITDFYNNGTNVMIVNYEPQTTSWSTGLDLLCHNPPETYDIGYQFISTETDTIYFKAVMSSDSPLVTPTLNSYTIKLGY